VRAVLFCHSLISDWNHGNAHFLRGVVTELQSRGVDVRVFEPADAWSVTNLLAHGGQDAIDGFHRAYPTLSSMRVVPELLDLDAALDGADLVLVHEWNDHPLVKRIGLHRARGGRYTLLFHDTHHRSVSDEPAMSAYDLQHYDGVLAFGEVIRERYLARGWARHAFTWHEAADIRMFSPSGVHRFLDTFEHSAEGPRTDGWAHGTPEWDLIWIGNWGDGERSAEIREFLIRPVRESGTRARVHGVRYPAEALYALGEAGIEYAGWLPNYRVPDAFGQAHVTVHIPRRPYVEALPGVPTIRVFEALACGIPLVSCWWDDCEGLFEPGEDYLVVRTPAEMTRAIELLRAEPDFAMRLAANGLRTVRARHTCAHRVNELFGIVDTLNERPVVGVIA
jgi:spore maturation protein CgeB